MPIYVYRCSNCHKEVEELQHISDPPLTTCPNCGSETMHKVISNVGIIFKGSGFYVTDNPHTSTGETTHHHHTSEENSSSSSEKSSQEGPIESAKEAAPATEGKSPSRTEAPKGDSDNKVA